MPVFAYDYSLGTQGLKEGLTKVGELIVQGMKDDRIFTWARRAMWQASLPVNASRTAIVGAIYRMQRLDMVFAEDPYSIELMMSAVKLLCLDPHGECVRGGDCDDNVIVLSSALMSVGIPVRLIIRCYPHMGQLHLMIQYDADPLNKGRWTCFDATSPDGACFAGYTTEAVISLDVGPMIVDKQPPQLLVLGRPPLFGAPPAPSSSLELTPGAMSVALTPGSSLALTLPSSGVWGYAAKPGHGTSTGGGIVVTGNATVGSSPSSGSNPAFLVYTGGAAAVTARWWTESLVGALFDTEHVTTISISDATAQNSNSPGPPMTTTTTTTTTTPTATLPADQSDAWAALLAAAKEKLDASVDRLNFFTGQMEAVRSDLGMPEVDPTPASESTSTASPIDLYATAGGYLWTAEAQNAQAKLSQTATFLSGVLGDAIAGTRQLYWNEGDLFVASVAGDPYGVLMKPIGGAGTALFPTYVDVQTGAATGKVGFGIAPILIGIGIVVASLAVVYAVTKIVDYLASAHREDAVSKIAAAQQALVDSGKQTPEQAAAFMRASADLVSAPPAAAASSGISIGWLVAAVAGGALAGVVGAEFLPKLFSARLSFAPSA